MTTINPDRIAVPGKPHVYFQSWTFHRPNDYWDRWSEERTRFWYIRWPDGGERERGVAETVQELGYPKLKRRRRKPGSLPQ